MTGENTIWNRTDMVIYQPNDWMKLDVKVFEDTVWLTQAQMVVLFQSSKANISEHLKNIFKQQELDYSSTVRVFRTVRKEGARMVNRELEYYNLDVIISIGFRVNTRIGIKFRQWANAILQEMMRNNIFSEMRLKRIENKLQIHEQRINGLIQTALPPKYGLFFDGQIFDAYVFVSELIKSARQSVKLIDNYMDESVLLMLSKREADVSAYIFTEHISPTFELDINRHNLQYPTINIRTIKRVHDRFMLIDDQRLYHFGASFKDLGKKMFAVSLIEDENIVKTMRQVME